VRYRSVWELQEALRTAILERRAEETLLLCEHEPVITLGRSAERSHVLMHPAELARRGIELCETSRGGDVTYHGPGQLVGYPVFRVRSVVAHVAGMAAALADAVAPLGVRAAWRREVPGLWVGSAKLAAFGVHIRRAVAIHGFALNVTTSLEAFSVIVPCGLACAQVTSLQALGVRPPALEELAGRVAAAFSGRRDSAPQRIDPQAIL